MFIFLLPDFPKQEIPHLLFRDIIDRMEFRVDTASIILLMEGVSPLRIVGHSFYVADFFPVKEVLWILYVKVILRDHHIQ